MSRPGSAGYQPIVDDILWDHLVATSILSAKIKAAVDQDIRSECERLSELLSKLPKTAPLETALEDEVMSVGEKLSARFMRAVLEDYGIAAEYVDLSHIVPSDEQNSQLNEDFYKRLAPIIGRRIEACGDKVPVITGYFGPIPGGLLHTCGRGYSDLLAALVAVGTSARELQVWKEVSGIYTADPRKVPTAKFLSTIDPGEVNELTFYGSEVIHHFTIDHCIPLIPIRIKNVKEPDGPGTLIVQKPSLHNTSINKSAYLYQRQKRPTAVTTKSSITIVNVHSHRKVGSPEFLAQICTILKKNKLAVDLFELNEMHVSLAVHSQTPFVGSKPTGTSTSTNTTVTSPTSASATATALLDRDLDLETQAAQHRDLQASIEELGHYGTVEVIRGMAIISLIGKELKRSIGIAGKFLTALGDNNINIEMISQGASEINISCVISARDERRAVNVVHTALFTFSD